MHLVNLRLCESVSAYQSDFYSANFHRLVTTSLSWVEHIACAIEGGCTTMIGGLAALIVLTSLCKCATYLLNIVCLEILRRKLCKKVFSVLPPSIVFCDFVLFFSSALTQTTDVPLQIPRTEAKLGEDLTLTCQASGDKVGLFFWYKMKFGYMVQTIAEGAVHKEITLQGQFNNSRFSIKKAGSLFHLSIKNVSEDDGGAYFCQSGAAYSMKFKNGTILAVNGKVSYFHCFLCFVCISV